jgi:hypothetical protein
MSMGPVNPEVDEARLPRMDGRHCHDCSLSEDARELSVAILQCAQAVLMDDTNSQWDEAKEAAEACLVAAFKAEARRHSPSLASLMGRS